MLPTPAELRELSKRLQEAVPKAPTSEMKQLLGGHAFRLAQVAEQLERDGGLDPYVAKANAERYEYFLGQALDEVTRRTAEKLLAENNAELGKQRSQIRAWRTRPEELRATADNFSVPSAQETLNRAAANYEQMADHAAALLTGKPSAPRERLAECARHKAHLGGLIGSDP
jgi:hypothetical protein